MKFSTYLLLALTLFSTLLINACGLKYDLYLPEHEENKQSFTIEE